MILEENKILVTCSGLGSRLGEITNYTNKSLVRIGKKPVLTHIIESYPKGSKFVITLGHYGDHVRQYVKLAHADIDVTFVNVDKFEGKGSSLAYSLLQARSHLNCAFIFHACDTITSNHEYSESQNCIWISSKKGNSSSYRTALTHGTSLKNIQEKGVSDNNKAYIGKCMIKDHESFWNILDKIYLENQDDSSLSDCHAINKMLDDGIHFSFKTEQCWSDIGNLDSLNDARQKFKEDTNVLDKVDESIYFVGVSVIKFFYDPKIVKSRVERVTHLSNTTPQITGETENFFAYEKFPGEVLSRYQKFNDSTLKSLLDWSYNRLWSSKEDVDISEISRNFYIKKTKERIRKYHSDRIINEANMIINGTYVPSTDKLLAKSENILMSHLHPSLFHGDFILENVLIDRKGDFTLIDWRQDFAGSKRLGDAYYDLAKMNHNLVVNHDIINDGHYTIRIDDNEVEVDILCSKKFIDAKNVIYDFCINKRFDMKKIEILTSIIWMNMAPLHDRNFGDFLFYFGKYNLMRALNEK